jgi:uncharacterized protein (TIGR02145 family)/uncharacterized repeat protein (TIGR02543 family)
VDGGTVTRFPNQENYAAREQVALSATAADGYTFIGWAGAETSVGATITITMDSNKPLVAMFNPASTIGAAEHTLVVTAFPENGGSTDHASTAVYSTGTSVTVTAAAATGYTFTGWSGASTSASSTTNITMDNSKTLVAMFTPIVYTLTVNTNPTTGGAVFINGTALMGAAPQNAGTQIEALAQPADGYVFTNWSGAATGTANPAIINITGSNQTLTANFQRGEGGTIPTPTTYVLTVNRNPSNIGIVTPQSGQRHAANMPINISAAAPSGYRFVNWTVTVGGTVANPNSTNTTVTLTANATVTANFQLQSTGGGVGVIEGDTLIYAGQRYRTVIIDGRMWMAENLNLDVPGSVCYGQDGQVQDEESHSQSYITLSSSEVQANCNRYGRLYDWATAMGFDPTCNSGFFGSCASQIQSPHQGICPVGWHVPSDDDWTALVNYVSTDGAGSNAGTRLKSTSGWYIYESYLPGTDDFGFSALPGGHSGLSGHFYNVGYIGNWWSATEGGAYSVWNRSVTWYSGNVYRDASSKTPSFSVRCRQDD